MRRQPREELPYSFSNLSARSQVQRTLATETPPGNERSLKLALFIKETEHGVFANSSAQNDNHSIALHPLAEQPT